MDAKTVTVAKDGSIPLESFADFVDITKVVYYEFVQNEDKTITLMFYDANKEHIKLKTPEAK